VGILKNEKKRLSRGVKEGADTRRSSRVAEGGSWCDLGGQRGGGLRKGDRTPLESAGFVAHEIGEIHLEQVVRKSFEQKRGETSKKNFDC